MGVHLLYFYFISFYCFISFYYFIICITQAFFPNLVSSVSLFFFFPFFLICPSQSPITVFFSTSNAGMSYFNTSNKIIVLKKALCICYTYYYNMSFFKKLFYM